MNDIGAEPDASAGALDPLEAPRLNSLQNDAAVLQE